MKLLHLASIILLAACHKSSLESQTKRQADEAADKKAKEEASSDSTQQASEPVPIGGSFLVCAHDPLLSQGSSAFGCRIETGAGDKVASFQAQNGDIVASYANGEVLGQALAEGFWHWRVEYSESLRASYSVRIVNPKISIDKNNAIVLEMHPRQTPGAPSTDPNSNKDDNPQKGRPAVSPVSPALYVHTIFVSSQMYQPGINGGGTQFKNREEAHVFCRKHAEAADLKGTYYALISDSNNSAKDLFTIRGKVQQPKGEIIANSSTFWGTDLANSISLSDQGTIPATSSKVWTGSSNLGEKIANANCRNWTENKGGDPLIVGQMGALNSKNAAFSNGTSFCDQSLHFYCMNDGVLIP